MAVSENCCISWSCRSRKLRKKEARGDVSADHLVEEEEEGIEENFFCFGGGGGGGGGGRFSSGGGGGGGGCDAARRRRDDEEEGVGDGDRGRTTMFLHLSDHAEWDLECLSP